MREGYSTHCVCLCVCVSLSTLEATLIYSANNGYQWTANDILSIFKKMKTSPSIQKQLSKLTALYVAMATPLTKVQSSFQRQVQCSGNSA